MMAHQAKEPMDLRELAPDVPEGLVDVVKKLMAKTPEDRYSGVRSRSWKRWSRSSAT